MPNIFDDLDTDPRTAKAADIRASAHIVNGGDATFTCPSCHGTGKFRSYAGRTVGDCFKCKGKGTVGKGVIAAAKGKATKEANRAAWATEHRTEIGYAQRRAERSSFYVGMLDKLTSFGSWTENQLALIRRDMAADAERLEQWKQKQNAAQAAKSGAVDVAAIVALFATATDNDIKRPIFRADGLEISKAAANGKNPGALYVKAGETYLGKIANGTFHAAREATDSTLATLRAIAADPLAEAVKYARRTGNCGCCGHVLVDPVSIRSGIGPICAEKWGLTYRRDAAREMLATEK